MKQKLNFILLSILILSLVIIVFSSCLHFLSGGEMPIDYGITIDAGSSKTKFQLYHWLAAKTNNTGFVEELATQKLTISIDEYANKIADLNKPMISTLNQISTKIEHTRTQFLIPIYLGATAGMRLLKAYNNDHSDKILREIRSSFEQFAKTQKRFEVANFEIIPGEKEGLYCWISVNYLMEYIPVEQKNSTDLVPYKGTIGILDMGGASAQIAFQISESSMTGLVSNEKTQLFGSDYKIFTYSNLCFGNDDARHRYQYVVISNNLRSDTNVVEDPYTHSDQLDRMITKAQILDDVCTNNDQIFAELKYDNYTFRANPDIKKCQENTKLLVKEDYVKKHFLSSSEEIKFRIMDEAPPIDMKFYALATYFYSTKQLRKSDIINFKNENELQNEIEEYCKKNWEGLVRGHEKEIDYLHNYCFALNYMFMYLKYVYRFSGDQFSKIEFREKLNGHDLGWSLGYMLQATNSIPQGAPEEPILNKTQFVCLSILGVALFLGVLYYFLKNKVAIRV